MGQCFGMIPERGFPGHLLADRHPLIRSFRSPFVIQLKLLPHLRDDAASRVDVLDRVTSEGLTASSILERRLCSRSVEGAVCVGDDVAEHAAHVGAVDVGGVRPVGVGAAPGVDVLAVDDDEVVAWPQAV
jgi:hypothetical protein